MFDRLVLFLETGGWPYSLPPSSPNTILVVIATVRCQYNCLFSVVGEKEAFSFEVFYPFTLTEGFNDSIYQLVNTINSKLLIGNFIVEGPESGIKFRIGSFYDTLSLKDEVITKLIVSAMSIIDVHHEIFDDFIHKRIDFEQAMSSFYNSLNTLSQR